jgi:D-glycero-D-manno-heptose 1,7-bisphosphate phosphatase
MKKAIFLDRDGVINADQHDYTWKIADFKFLPGVFEACRNWQAQGFLLIVITNQGGIAKGLYDHSDVEKLHAVMVAGFENENVHLTQIYYCPHHPVGGNCLCRKPGSLLVEKAIATYNIDPKTSWFIGDRDRDVEAATGAGVRGILIPVNGNLMDVYKNHTW